MSSALSMFRKSASHGDVKKSAQKVADPKKDTVTRLKHLRTVLETYRYDVQEAKRFFQENYSHIYYIFYDNFSSIEADLKQRANKAHKEELESILVIFERILYLIPELIHKRWMFHSIGGILKKLLHPGNCIKLRREGMRLFIIWYQILQDNASEECHQIFLQLVPGLGEGQHQEVLLNRIPTTPDIEKTDPFLSPLTCSGMIAAGEITPILSATGEKIPENITKYFLDALLACLVSEVIKIEWMNKEMKETSFIFLFNKFKQYYLTWLLPNFQRNRDIYEPALDLPRIRSMEEMGRLDYPANVSECRDSFIRWLANFTLMSKKPAPTSQNKGYLQPLLTDTTSTASNSEDERRESSEMKEDTTDNASSKESTLTTNTQFSEKDPVLSISSDEHTLSEYEIVRSVLFSTRENVNIIHECFRQALLFSFKHADAIRRVITVYKEWFQHVDKRPVFMCEPLTEVEVCGGSSPDLLHSSLSDIVEEGSSDESPSSSNVSVARQGLFPEGMDKPRYIRNASYLGAVQELADEGVDNKQFDVRAGLQSILQVFITNSANIFLLETTDDSSLQEQVDLCKRVLNIYRYLVMSVVLNQNTWEQMLVVLLRVTSGVLKQNPPTERHKSLGGRLAQPIFQTLIVTWIKANLNVLIPIGLWNDFLQVLSSLTPWREVVKEWAKTMETLTRVLANQVYGLHLYDLPLERLSEQKEKRKRGKESRSRSVSDKGFSRSWGKSESGSALRGSTNSAPSSDSPFERGKYRSDGSIKSKHEMHKQRSLSGEPSPAHSRSGSDPTDIMIRSSSEGNIADPSELLEKLRGLDTEDNNQGMSACDTPSESGASAAMEDDEVARINYTVSTCTAELTSGQFIQCSADNVSLDKSDYDPLIPRVSATPSPVSLRSKSGSATPSPTSEMNITNKYSPTPDRDSLHIDMVAGADEDMIHRDLDESKSVLSGGTVTGWMPDVAVVLWKRMLGCLGNVNNIDDPNIHASVFEYLSDLQDTMMRMRDNLGVTSDNLASPAHPVLIPEQQKFASWIFECIKLSNKYKEGKLFAYQLLCQIMLQRHDISPSLEILSQYYYILHNGLLSSDQDVANVLIRICGPKYFGCQLPASRLLMLDFIHAASSIITAMDVREPPRAEAVSLLGSLLCFPNHFHEMPVLKPNSVDRIILSCNDMKNHIIDSLLVAGKREPAGPARCIAVSSIGIFLYEELTHGTLHSKIKDGIDILLAALKCVNKRVAKVASDMLMLLCDHTDKLLNYHTHLPKKIIEVIISTISSLLASHESSSSEEDKRLIVLMMFSLVEWCMKIPIHLLMETTDTDRSSLYKVFRVLHSAVTGHSSTSLPRSANSLSDFMQDSDFNNITDNHSPTVNSSPKSQTSETVADDHPTKLPETPNVFDPPRQSETDIVKLAARTSMKHLVNHLCHFPMGSGPGRLNTLVQEHHDIPDYIEEDLKPDIFSAANVQFFVLNHRCLVSFVELPAKEAPGGGVTAGLTTAKTVCRVVVRDVGGKFCWESSVLYSPPWCKKGSSLHNAQLLLGHTTEMELEPLIIQEDSDINLRTPPPQRSLQVLPSFDNMRETDDNLDDLLCYIGNTSPECLLRLGKPLNINPPIPQDLCDQAEGMMTSMVLDQRQAELEYYKQHKADVSMLAKPELPDEIEDPISPFQMCRMLLDQMGLMSWDKRCQFDLLKQTDKLLRELKNLDNQKCRETHKIAVIYVATGQEDKNSILSNTSGSRDYETFVAGLGWEVDLENHQGFLGGLQKNKTTGDTAPYFANSSYEVIFHVSTRMPVGTDESKHVKMRHLGNDEVHIVWSEHTRDYRRGIIPTEFGDIIIIIYPLTCGLYRIQINRKHEVPYFGPLFDGAIIDSRVLPGLVRATAINASRIKRSLMPFFHSFYEERAKCLETIIQQNTENTTFEDFAACIFVPVLPSNSAIVDNSVPSESSSPASLSDTVLSDISGVTSPATLRHGRASETSLPDKSDREKTDSAIVRTAKRFSMKARRSSTSESPVSKSKGSVKEKKILTKEIHI